MIAAKRGLASPAAMATANSNFERWAAVDVADERSCVEQCFSRGLLHLVTSRSNEPWVQERQQHPVY